ncbi:MAG TPA: RluA family pseudouridine synthase [Thermodesulfobacteriota bacterium]|nr:RluA family pseudouridine synthase [Thermodesulfobacteriota bacterium]
MSSKPSKSDPLLREWIFAAGDAPPQRLEKFLQQKFLDLSRRNIRVLIAEDRVRVNHRTADKGYRLQAGDHLEIRLPAPLTVYPVPEPARHLTIIYQDEDLIVVDKPALLPTHPLSPFETGTLTNALISLFPELAGVGPKSLEAGLIHRLDTGTSGILIAGRNPAAWSQLKQDLAQRLWNKIYLALVAGDMEPMVLTVPLAHHPRDRRRMVALKDRADPHRGRIFPAETRFRVLRRFRDLCLLEADLITGVTHQIRVHLAESGHLVVGDLLYGPGGPTVFDLAPGRLFLHAAAVELLHPVTRKKLLFKSGLPEDLQGVLGSLIRK